MERAIFVSVITSNTTEEQVIEYLDELEFLAETAGVVGERRFMQRLDRPNSKTYVGTGKLEEIKIF
jgi:GTP-binding protein HflX